MALGDHMLAYRKILATIASIAKLRARASAHSVTISWRWTKRITAIPGQTKRNHITITGRTTTSVITKVTRPTAIVERIRVRGHHTE